jgi:hypothetical protein
MGLPEESDTAGNGTPASGIAEAFALEDRYGAQYLGYMKRVESLGNTKRLWGNSHRHC